MIFSQKEKNCFRRKSQNIFVKFYLVFYNSKNIIKRNYFEITFFLIIFMLFITFNEMKIKIVLFNESKNFFEQKRKKFWNNKKGEMKMKIDTSPNQKVN